MKKINHLTSITLKYDDWVKLLEEKVEQEELIKNLKEEIKEHINDLRTVLELNEPEKLKEIILHNLKQFEII